MTNDEGLPIHEIREDEHGKLIGELPSLTAGGSSGSGSAIIEEIPVDIKDKDDFWSEAAIARREALRRKVFDDPSDSELDESDAEAGPNAAPPTPPPGSRPGVSINTTTSAPSINAIPPTPSSPAPGSLPEPPVRRPSGSTLPPKSILKPSAPRKKSVSFDSSVPLPPDSPAPNGPSELRIGGSMFPTPVINIESGIQEREVPTLNAPKRSPKRSTFGDPFAGFKPGFLGGNGKLSPPTATTGPVSEEPSTMSSSVKEVAKSVEEAGPKKESRFAQRQRESDQHTSTTSGTASTTTPSPAFPSMSTAKGTTSVKNIVLEKPSTPSTPTASSSSSSSRSAAPQFPSDSTTSSKTTQTAVAQTVKERSQPVAGPSRLNGETTREKSPLGQSNQYEDEYSDDDDEEDDDFYADDDDGSDGYDLDDAMLAREVALAYHQNLAYTDLAQSRSRGDLDEDEQTVQDYLAQLQLREDQEGAEGEIGESGGAGVMMALPQISILGNGTDQRPRIINPTPDNLRKFVRVGKLDNGKLVLAPGESGWSDEEDGDEEETDDVAGDHVGANGVGVGAGGGHIHQDVTKRGAGTANGKGGSQGSRRKENREEIRRALLGGQGIIEHTPAPPQQLVEGEMGLPPTIGAGPTPTARSTPPTPAVGSVMESAPKTVPVVEKPKKVSRFKADRMNV